MANEVVAALIAVGGLVLVNIGLGLYQYGRLTQQVKDLCRRVSIVEGNTNGKGEKS